MRWSRWIIGALLPLVVACSAVRLSYNQGPVLAYWWLDGYADFNAEQSPGVKAALEDWFAWHRASQLPDYAQALAAMGALAVGNVTAPQVCGVIEAWRQRGERAFERAVPAIAEQLRTLNPDQIRQIERHNQRKYKDAVADYLQPELTKRHKVNFQRALDRAETMYGKLDEAQRRRFAADLMASPFNPEVWLNERNLRQADILRALRQWQAERSDTATVQAGLRRMGAEALQSPRADYRAYASSLMDANCGLLAVLHNGTNLAQRRHAVAQLKAWEDDLRALISR